MKKDFYKLGIIGNPLSHSISPAIQTSALLSANLKGSYEKFEVLPENISNLINDFKAQDFDGFNVTIPHKLEILKYLDETDETAQKIGAVNTVKITDDKKLIGYNTDICGFHKSISDFSVSNASILGCGGAALAVVFGLEKQGCKNLTVYARNLNKAEIFISNIKEKTTINLFAKSLESLTDLSDTDILINATPLGTIGENQNKAAINKDTFSTAKATMIAYDLVYNPAETLFLKYAKSCGLKTVNGLDMLILQGAKAFEIWTGKYPNTEQMKKSAEKELCL